MTTPPSGSGRIERCAGIDEVGRGPLAGPVTAAAVILDSTRPIDGLNDSKKLKVADRERLAEMIRERALGWALGWASVEEIDRINILNASLLAMSRAVEALHPVPDQLLVDGRHCLDSTFPCRAIIGGDATVPAISAASILAKVARDALMVELHATYPVYGFDRHKGYGTREHRLRLEEHGPSPIHRRSFSPVRQMLALR